MQNNELLNSHLFEDQSNLVGEIIGAAAQLGSSALSIAAKSDAKAQAEATCGKQPHGVFGIKTKKKKKKIEDWNNCVKEATANILLQEKAVLTQKNKEIGQKELTEKEKTKRIVYVTVGVLALTVITLTGIVIYKKVIQ